MFIIDTARQKAGKLILKRLRFADAVKWTTLLIFLHGNRFKACADKQG